jgi:hypothetical protein
MRSKGRGPIEASSTRDTTSAITYPPNPYPPNPVRVGSWVSWRLLGALAWGELPVLIGRAGDRAAIRFVEFFTVNSRNKNTAPACSGCKCNGAATGMDVSTVVGGLPLKVLSPF